MTCLEMTVGLPLWLVTDPTSLRATFWELTQVWAIHYHCCLECISRTTYLSIYV